VRIGLVATKRLGNAVRRNRARRLLREAIRKLGPSLRPGSDLVIVARSALLDASLDQIQAALSETLSRAGLLGGPPPENSSVDGLQF